jgi:pimeloyl-ACP methyl ester carboxylesterase
MPISRANGLDIYYATSGTGPPLVLIHALPFDHHLWLYQVARFASRFRTIAMDLRGWGRSERPRTPFTFADMGRDILGLLADEGVTSDANSHAIVLGCSIGSKLALMLACDRPDLFAAAILVGGNSGPQPQLERRIAGYRAAHAAGKLADYHLAHLRYGVTEAFADSPLGRYLIAGFAERGQSASKTRVNALSALDPECIAHVFQALMTCDLTPKLRSYSRPTLIVNGEHDNALPGGKRTAALIPHAEHRILPRTGHCCFMEDPFGFEAIVRDFLVRHGLWPAVR